MYLYRSETKQLKIDYWRVDQQFNIRDLYEDTESLAGCNGRIVEGTDGKGESRNRRGFKGFADEPEDQNATPISALHPRGGTLREKGSSVMPARGRTCAFPFARLGTATYES